MPICQINSKSIFYTVAEPEGKSKADLLLVHGLGSSSSYYAAIIPALKSYGYRCISMDTYGSGRSKLQSSQAENSISTISSDAIGVLDHLGVLARVTAIGHSMGCIVVNNLAAQYPDRIERVICIGPVHPQPKMADIFTGRIQTIKKDNSVEALANMTPTAATGGNSKPIHHAFIRALILGTEPEGYISLCNVIATADAPDYASIKAPLLIISGKDDQTTPRSGSELILEKYGTKTDLKEIVDLEGVGHWHCIEAPDPVTDVILNFIDRTST